MDPTRPVLHMFIHDIACQLWPHYVATFSDLGVAANAHAGTHFDPPHLISMNHIHYASKYFDRFDDEWSDSRIKISSSFVNEDHRLSFLDYENHNNNAWFKRWVDFLEYEAGRLVKPSQPFPQALPRAEHPSVTVVGLRAILPA